MNEPIHPLEDARVQASAKRLMRLARWLIPESEYFWLDDMAFELAYVPAEEQNLWAWGMMHLAWKERWKQLNIRSPRGIALATTLSAVVALVVMLPQWQRATPVRPMVHENQAKDHLDRTESDRQLDDMPLVNTDLQTRPETSLAGQEQSFSIGTLEPEMPQEGLEDESSSLARAVEPQVSNAPQPSAPHVVPETNAEISEAGVDLGLVVPNSETFSTNQQPDVLLEDNIDMPSDQTGSFAAEMMATPVPVLPPLATDTVPLSEPSTITTLEQAEKKTITLFVAEPNLLKITSLEGETLFERLVQRGELLRFETPFMLKTNNASGITIEGQVLGLLGEEVERLYE